MPGTDYTATSKTSIVLTQAASLNDTLEVVAYDIATMDDTISKADGGTFEAYRGNYYSVNYCSKSLPLKMHGALRRNTTLQKTLAT